MEKLDVGVHAINDIQQWYMLVSFIEYPFRKFLFIFVQTGSSCKWANDSQRLLLENFDVISTFPSQVYHFALPFCPSSSWLHGCYAAELSQKVKVVKGLQTEWGACSRTVLFDIFP